MPLTDMRVTRQKNVAGPCDFWQAYDRKQKSSLAQVSALQGMKLIPDSAKKAIDLFLQQDDVEGLAVSAPEAKVSSFTGCPEAPEGPLNRVVWESDGPVLSCRSCLDGPCLVFAVCYVFRQVTTFLLYAFVS